MGATTRRSQPLLVLLVALGVAFVVAAQWVGFHGGWPAIGARLAGIRPGRTDD